MFSRNGLNLEISQSTSTEIALHHRVVPYGTGTSFIVKTDFYSRIWTQILISRVSSLNGDFHRIQDIHGYPLTVANPKIPNPKDIVQKSLTDMTSLRDQLAITRQELIDGTWLGPVDDAIEVLSMPVFMIIQAVDSMQVSKHFTYNSSSNL